MIKLILLTGFLGAGKTTLMTSLLESYQNCKTGVIINEFGTINIDAKLIQKDGIEMAELSNGSIFCACIKDKFVDSLIAMSKTDIEYLFIEASGLADPSNMPQILDGIRHKTDHNYGYSGSLCIVDGESFLDLLDLLPVLERQVEYGDSVIINKSDLIGQEEIAKISEKIQEINPGVSLYVTSYCRADIRDIVEHFDEKRKEGKETTNTVSSRPASFVLTATALIPFADLEEFLEDIAKDSYRIKGFIRTEQGPLEISAVGRNIQCKPWHGEIEKDQIVVISAIGIRMLSMITTALEKKLKGKLSF